MNKGNKPIRALLLAGGLGSRLRPLTDQIPKCMVPIKDEPLLQRWLRHLRSIGCEQVIINTHYLSDQVNSFLDKIQRDFGNMSIIRVHEKELKGTAGTLVANLDYFDSCTSLLIHADNVTNNILEPLLKAHENRREGCLVTMLTFETESPSQCGIVEVDKYGVVQAFYEKVQDPPGNRANGAIYIFDQDFIKFLRSSGHKYQDFSTEILPLLVGKIQTWHTNEPYMDIGTPEALAKAQQLWNSF